MNFNSEEKEILKQLVEYDFSGLKTIGDFLSEKIVIQKDIRLLLTTQSFNTQDNHILFYKKDKQYEAVKYLMIIGALLNQLLENKLMYIYPMGKSYNTFLCADFHFIGGESKPILKACQGKYIEFSNGDYLRSPDFYWCNSEGDTKYETVGFDDSDLPLWDIARSYPTFSEELIELVKNNFKTTEQKSLFWTRIAAVASFGAFLASIIIPHACSTRIDNEQYNGFMKSDTTTRQEINMRLDAIDESTHQIINTKTDTTNIIE